MFNSVYYAQIYGRVSADLPLYMLSSLHIHTQCVSECINLQAAVVTVQDEHNGEKEEITNEVWYSENQLNPLPLTSSFTLLVSVPASLFTEQLYTPASLRSRLVISNTDLIGLPAVLMTLLPSPRRNALPSFFQWICGSGMPVKVHTSSKWVPSVWVIGAGRSTMVGWAVGERDVHISSLWGENASTWHLLQNLLLNFSIISEECQICVHKDI